ncbi:class I SAM-dependent methyltransferase [Candidatus Entotheonella palauensis]|uniref:class I SAM-dependent methyltransferase n=1 Tax=Candidatus Entotheonella palauensis TaxID=93172 RepID=UPI0021191FB9|nr:class I SAM-dependent methyltransferase [Candidatus Entotheonella palauensis]
MAIVNDKQYLKQEQYQDSQNRTALRQARHTFQYEVIDAQAIPYADQTFDAVIANHMLYHVPNRPQALREIHRVLKPDGTFYATANSVRYFQEVYALIQEINPRAELRLFQTAFGFENGAAQVAESFNTVNSEAFDSALAITDSAPLFAYIQSTRHATWIQGQEPLFRQRVDREIQLHGAMPVTTSGGLITAQNDITTNCTWGANHHRPRW